MEGLIYKLWQALHIDGLTFNKLATYCMVEYRMNFNPLPAIRKYVDKYAEGIPVHYTERGYKLDRDAVLNIVCGRAVPLIVVIAIKREGYCEKVDMRMITTDSCKVDPDGIINYI